MHRFSPGELPKHPPEELPGSPRIGASRKLPLGFRMQPRTQHKLNPRRYPSRPQPVCDVTSSGVVGVYVFLGALRLGPGGLHAAPAASLREPRPRAELALSCAGSAVLGTVRQASKLACLRRFARSCRGRRHCRHFHYDVSTARYVRSRARAGGGVRASAAPGGRTRPPRIRRGAPDSGHDAQSPWFRSEP